MLGGNFEGVARRAFLVGFNRLCLRWVLHFFYVVQWRKVAERKVVSEIRISKDYKVLGITGKPSLGEEANDHLARTEKGDANNR